jgi:hypothetical protein
LGWSKDPGPPSGGEFPRHFILTMSTHYGKKTLSVFIDESGDFGSYEAHAPYYLVAMVLHNVRDFKKNYLKHIRKKVL